MVSKKRTRGIPDEIQKAMIWILNQPRAPGQKPIRSREMLKELLRSPEMERLIEDILVLGPNTEAQEKKIGRQLEKWGEPKNHDPLDEVFDWRRLTDAGLGWEASDVVLNLWAYDQKLSVDRERQTLEDNVNRPATMRKALWWWKVHCATGEFRENRLDLQNMSRTHFVWQAAEVFWLADWYESSLGISQDTSGNWAILAYKPWGNIVRRDAYNSALDENRISPPLNVVYRKDGNGNIAAMELVPKDGGVYRRKPPKNFEEWKPSDAALWVSADMQAAA